MNANYSAKHYQSVTMHFRRNLARKRHFRQGDSAHALHTKKEADKYSSQAAFEVGEKAVSIVHIAFRRADPRHTNKARRCRTVNDVETQRPGREQLLKGAHVDCWVHRASSCRLFAILGRYVDQYLARIETFSTEELIRVFAAVREGLCIAQFLTQAQRPRVDGVGLAAFGRRFATDKLARAGREAKERNKPDVYNKEVGIVLELRGSKHGTHTRA